MLGVHWFTDVLAGLAVGWGLVRPVLDRLRRTHPPLRRTGRGCRGDRRCSEQLSASFSPATWVRVGPDVMATFPWPPQYRLALGESLPSSVVLQQGWANRPGVDRMSREPPSGRSARPRWWIEVLREHDASPARWLPPPCTGVSNGHPYLRLEHDRAGHGDDHEPEELPTRPPHVFASDRDCSLVPARLARGDAASGVRSQMAVPRGGSGRRRYANARAVIPTVSRASEATVEIPHSQAMSSTQFWPSEGFT